MNGLINKRIKLIKMNDDPNPIDDGEEGTVTKIDDIGNIHVKWDNGRTLSLIPGIDDYEILNESKKFIKSASDFFNDNK